MSLVQMSVSGGAVVLVIVLLRALALYRLPKRFFSALWSLPLIRLLVPFSIPAAFSVYSLLDQQVPASIPVPAPRMISVPNVVTEETAPLAAGTAPVVDPFALLWLTGALACAVFFLSAYIRCRWKFRESLPVNNPRAQDWLLAHPLRRQVSLRDSDRITSPLTYGIFRPVVLMPKSTDWQDRETLDFVLSHELAHIRRFDGLRKLALGSALCVHWFNPLVWVMYFLGNRDIELACDEAVLRQLGLGERAGYAMTLIRMEEHRSRLPGGSYFSKNSIEERIRAIMKIKKHSLAILLAALVLTGGTAAVFATSAKAENRNDNSTQTTYAEAQTDAVMVWEEADGSASLSLDGGKSWMTEAEFEERFQSGKIEWWTPEDYAAWLEKEKEELQSIIGSRGWTGSTGWFTWTPELVAETIAEYEKTLAQIQEGRKVAKPIYDEDGGMIMYAGDYAGAYEETSGEALEYVSDFGSENFRYGTLSAYYKKYGLIFDSDDGNLYWNGQRVRIFVDGAELGGGYVSAYEHYDPEGEIDLHTVRERVENGDGSYDPMGPLVGIEEFEPEQMFLDELEARRYLGDEIQYEARQTATELERYSSCGLTFTIDSRTGKISMAWNGQPVRSLFDPERQLWIANSLGGKGLDLETVYKDGKLTGLKISEERDREFVETGAVIGAEATAVSGTGDGSGETIAQRMKKYAPYGVSYEESDGERVVRYDGQIVKRFTDDGPEGTFSVESSEPGIVRVQTVYGENGKLDGVEVVPER